MNFMQRTPFIRLLLALMSGIVLFQYIRLSMSVLAGISFLVSVALISTFFLHSARLQHRLRWVFGVAVAVLLSTAGYLSCLLFEKNHSFTELNQRAVYEVELMSAPLEKARSYSCKAKLLRKSDTAGAGNPKGAAIIYLQKDSAAAQLLLGDRLLLEAEFKTPDGVQNPNGFDYAAYLKRQGIGAICYVSADRWKKTGANTSFSIVRLSDRCRKYLLDIYRQFHITGDEFAVLAALTLGYTDELDTVVIKSYSATGASHILSVSGLHVGIVYVVIYFLLGFLKKSRKQKILRSVITTLFIWLYAFITGMSPAVIRAALMLTFVSAGSCLNRNSQIYNTILISAFLMLVVNPNLLFNIGFQLSYAAVISIVFFQPKISRLIYIKNKFLKGVWDLTAVSLAAQVGTAPIAIYYFHQFPNYFLLTNYVAIPLSTLVIYLSIGLFAVSWIPYLSVVVAFMLKWALWLMNHLIVFIQEIPGSVTVISMNGFQVVVVFCALSFFIAYYFDKKFSMLAAGLFGLFVIISVYVYQQYRTITTSRIVVFADSRTPVINFIDGKKNFVFTPDVVQAEKIAANYWKSNLLEKPEYLSENEWFNDGFATFEHTKIIILKDTLLKNKVAAAPIETDYLIICNKTKPRMEEVLACIRPKRIIVDKSISAWYANRIAEDCKTRDIPCYSIAEKGAFIAEFER